MTLGQMRTYLTHYHTTLGQTLYVTEDWESRSDADKYILLRHERVHMKQFQRWTIPIMAVLYVLAPLPMGLALFRCRFEQEAYAETIRASAEVYGKAYVCAPQFREGIVRQFLGPSYGWMWPFRGSIETWYEQQLADI